MFNDFLLFVQNLAMDMNCYYFFMTGLTISSKLKDAIQKAHSGRMTSMTWQTATCPYCGSSACGTEEIDSVFGFRNMDGIIRSQSWCKRCRRDKKA